MTDASTFERAAQHIITTCLAVTPGEHILIAGGIHQYPFLSRMALHARILGAHPQVSISDDETTCRTYHEVPAEFLLAPPTDHDYYQARLFDAAIHVDAMWDHSLLKDVPSSLMAKLSARGQELRTIKYDPSRRTIAMAWPTDERANRAGMSLDQLTELFWQAVFVDLDDMHALSTALADHFRSGDRVRIRSAKGTDISFSIKGRKVLIDGGRYDEASRANREIMKNLPCGEVYTTPIEDTVEGRVIFDEVFLKGNKVEDLELKFSDGRITSSMAAREHDVFYDLWKDATGDKDRVGEFAIGTNPHIRHPIGDDLFDEKIFGSIHLALGENRMYGGTNSSSIHWDFVVQNPSVTIDDHPILEDGRFLVP